MTDLFKLPPGNAFLLRSAAITGTATVSGTGGESWAGTAHCVGAIRESALVTFEVKGTPTGTARLIMLATPDGWPSAVITSLVRTALGVTTAFVQGGYPYVVADLRGVDGVTANLHFFQP